MAVGTSKRPHKRRRTLTSPVSNVLTGSADTPVPSVIPATSKSSGFLACKSCHRSSAVIPGQIIRCPRCSAPTCAICSRTCNTRVPSQPPTPHLTWSSSPSPTQSSRSLSTGLDSNSNSGAEKITKATGKRRKDTDDDSTDAIDDDFRSDTDYGTEPGCGRTICRDCCIENIQSNTISCYDCYGQ